MQIFQYKLITRLTDVWWRVYIRICTLLHRYQIDYDGVIIPSYTGIYTVLHQYGCRLTPVSDRL